MSYKEVEGFLKSKSEKEESLKVQNHQIEKEKQEELKKLNKLNKDAGYKTTEEYNKEIEQETKRLEDCLWSGKMHYA